MRCDADAQLEDPTRAGFLDELDGAIERRQLARDHELFGRIRVGHAHDAAGLMRGSLAGQLESAAIQTNDGRHAARSMVALLLHQPSALTNELERIPEVERSSGDERRVLTQAVAGDVARRLPL